MGHVSCAGGDASGSRTGSSGTRSTAGTGSATTAVAELVVGPPPSTAGPVPGHSGLLRPERFACDGQHARHRKRWPGSAYVASAHGPQPGGGGYVGQHAPHGQPAASADDGSAAATAAAAATASLAVQRGGKPATTATAAAATTTTTAAAAAAAATTATAVALQSNSGRFTGCWNQFAGWRWRWLTQHAAQRWWAGQQLWGYRSTTEQQSRLRQQCTGHNWITVGSRPVDDQRRWPA